MDGVTDGLCDQDRRWHRRLVPETAAEREAAARAFCWDTTWVHLSEREVVSLLGAWFDRGWTLHGLFHALDHDPEGEPLTSPPRRPTVDQLAARLRRWINPLGQRRRPPEWLEALDREWVAARERERQAQLAAARARWVAPGRATAAGDGGLLEVRRRADALARVRERDRRIRVAMDSLGPGPRLHEPEPARVCGGADDDVVEQAARRESGLDRAQQAAAEAGEVSPELRRVLTVRYRDYRMRLRAAGYDPRG